MARNDGIDRTLARNRDLSANDIKNAQAHNEREKEMYSNPDIVPEETHRNIHFKQPTGSYTEMFDQLKKDAVISTRGLKKDATTYCVFDGKKCHASVESSRVKIEERKLFGNHLGK